MIPIPLVLNQEIYQAIRDSAQNIARGDSINPQWERAYHDLADAADRLHAMEARLKVETFLKVEVIADKDLDYLPLPSQ